MKLIFCQCAPYCVLDYEFPTPFLMYSWPLRDYDAHAGRVQCGFMALIVTTHEALPIA
jgi:hypothetical protein